MSLIFLAGVKKEELDQELLIKLEQASSLAEVDFTVTSGFRPGVDGVDHGIKNGPHMSHKAADLRCHDSMSRFKILNGLFRAGFRRIGIGKVHIHCDVASLPTFPQIVAWLELDDDK